MTTSEKQQATCKGCGALHTFMEIARVPHCKQCGSEEFTFVSQHDTPVCDFCSTPHPSYSYPCRDFRQDIGMLGAPDYGSAGWWAACEPCHRLIQNGDRQALAEHSADTWLEKNPDDRLPRDFIVAHIRELHDNFWSNREGPALEHVEATDGN